MPAKIHAHRKSPKKGHDDREPAHLDGWFLPVLSFAFLSLCAAALLYEYRVALIVMYIIVMLACVTLLAWLMYTRK